MTSPRSMSYRLASSTAADPAFGTHDDELIVGSRAVEGRAT